VKLGVVLPTFTELPDDALDAARESESGGLDGIFVFDHLWPLGHPGRPAISAFPLLGMLAALTDTIALGTLVARVGLVPDALLLAQLTTVDLLSGGRLVAGIGTGDQASRAENEGYGIDFASAAVRRAELEALGHELVARDMSVWVGGGAHETNVLARRLGVTLNLWGAEPRAVAAAAAEGPVSWSGNLPKEREAASDLLSALAAAGATWAVFAWPGSVGAIRAPARLAGLL
jgi:alkanesulfonate monooxygenase SsuD/methylene tetrahydromethanopterin reductase-like flavin-dependent oxidoreductase (luciferase family)